MKINLDYNFSEVDKKDIDGEDLDPREVTYGYIQFAINKKYKEGLEGQKRRIWGRIQRKFDAAIDTKEDEIALEISEIDFIKKAFEECQFLPQMAKYIFILEDEMERVSKKETEEKK